MIAYVDSSVILRIELQQPQPLSEWTVIERSMSSVLTRVECLRTLDRLRIARYLDDATVATARSSILGRLDGLESIPLDPAILDRAGEPFPTSLRALDAIHLASALAIRDEVPDMVIATHDRQLGLAARAMGFEVLGLEFG